MRFGRAQRGGGGGAGGRRRSRRLLVAAWASGVLALLVVGAAGGHLLWPPTTVEVTEVADGPGAEQAVGPVDVPDLLGLTEAVARQALADAGVTGEVVVTAVAAAGDPGVVTSQAPAPGPAEDGGGQVSLTVSELVLMPDLVGQGIEQARAALEAAGPVVLLRRVVDPSAPAGTVVASVPAAGEGVTASVELSVADPGTPLLLTDLGSSDNAGCSGGYDDVALGTTDVTEGLGCRAGDASDAGADPSFVEWDVQQRAAVWQLAVGLAPDGAQVPVPVRLLADGVQVSAATARSGSVQVVRVSVAGASRLRVEIGAVRSDEDVRVVVADPVVFGDERLLEGLR